MTNTIDRQTLAHHLAELEDAERTKASAAEQARAKYRAAKDDGLALAPLRQLVRERLMSPEELQAQDANAQILAEYRQALGDLADTPLGRAALDRGNREGADEGSGQGEDVMLEFAGGHIAVEKPRRRRTRKVLFDRNNPDGWPPAA